MTPSAILGVAWIGLGLVVLSLSELSEHSEGTLGLDSSIAAAAVMLISWPIGLALILASTSLGWLARRRGRSIRRIAAVSTAKALAFFVAVGSVAATAGLARRFGTGSVSPIVATAYLLSFVVVLEAANRTSEGRLHSRILMRLRDQGLLIAAQLSCSVLAVMAFSRLGPWSLMLVVALLLLMQRAHSLLADATATYEQTVRVIVETVEAHRPERAGHAYRVAEIARSIGMRLSMSQNQLISLNYAALLHDAGRDASVQDFTTARSAAVAREAHFLGEVHPALEILDSRGVAAYDHGESELMNAFIVALASDIDDIREGREREAQLARNIAEHVPSSLKGRVVGSAVGLGYPTPVLH